VSVWRARTIVVDHGSRVSARRQRHCPSPEAQPTPKRMVTRRCTPGAGREGQAVVRPNAPRVQTHSHATEYSLRLPGVLVIDRGGWPQMGAEWHDAGWPPVHRGIVPGVRSLMCTGRACGQAIVCDDQLPAVNRMGMRLGHTRSHTTGGMHPLWPMFSPQVRWGRECRQQKLTWEAARRKGIRARRIPLRTRPTNSQSP
jgi:hypothetical protein